MNKCGTIAQHKYFSAGTKNNGRSGTCLAGVGEYCITVQQKAIPDIQKGLIAIQHQGHKFRRAGYPQLLQVNSIGNNNGEGIGQVGMIQGDYIRGGRNTIRVPVGRE